MRLEEKDFPKSSGDLVLAFMRSGRSVMEVLDDDGSYRSVRTLYSALYNYLKRNRTIYPDIQVYYRKGHCYLRRIEPLVKAD